MGVCIGDRKDEHFLMNDLNGIDILRWITDSKGPWKTPDSFVCFKEIDAKNSPVNVSNEDEIRIHSKNKISFVASLPMTAM